MMRDTRLAWVLLGIAGIACAQPLPASQAQRTTVTDAERTTAPAAIQGSTPADDGIVDLDTMVVSGVQPGPGLWKVTARNGHVLWVLGTLSPLPRGMEWDTKAIEQAIAGSQQVLLSPSVDVDADVGFFGKLTLIPTALKARRNPDGKRLQDLVPAAQYARWQVLKARYIGGDRGIEQWRPVFAALELYEKAIRRAGMSGRGVVAPQVARLAKKHGVATVAPVVKVAIREPRKVLKEFAATTLDDGDCFAKTLARIETDLGTMRARANAWAIGDVQTLRELPFGNQFAACTAAFSGAALARRIGVADMGARLETKWLAAAEAAMARNASTFATLPIAELLKSDGYLAKLQAKGYEVEAP